VADARTSAAIFCTDMREQYQEKCRKKAHLENITGTKIAPAG
jgi:hypothetical protein